MTRRKAARMLGRVFGREERGAFLVLWALVAVIVVTMVAIAIDLQSLRTDRRADRLATDAAVTAGVAGVGGVPLGPTPGGRFSACKAAWQYAARNLGQTSLVGQADTQCAPFSAGTSCTDVGAPPTQTGSATPSLVTSTMGPYTITIATPINDGDTAWMSADATGGPIAQSNSASTTTSTQSDGTPCQRLGVSIQLTRDPFFAQILGAGPHTTKVHSVARWLSGTVQLPSNVVLLDPHDCNVLVQNSASGGVIVSDTSGTNSGALVVLSDATGGPDGPCTAFSTFSDYEIVAKGNGSGNGIIVNPGDLYLGGYSGSSCSGTHACNESEIGSGANCPTSGGSIQISEALNGACVHPRPIPIIVDRSIVDYLFNCKTSYTSMSEATPENPPRSSTTLAGCPAAATAGDADYVNQYVKGVKAGDLLPTPVTVVNSCAGVSGSVTGNFDYKCGTNSFPNNFALTVNGSARFEQASLTPGAVTITGNAVVDNALNITNGKSFIVNGNAEFGGATKLSGATGALSVTGGASTYPTTCLGALFMTNLASCVLTSGSDFHTVYLDTGFSLAQSGGTLTFDHTFAYEAYDASSKTGAVLSLGGGGSINWGPPSVGPFVQPNASGVGTSQLALWSDDIGSQLGKATAPLVQSLAGGGAGGGIQMSGVFFTPGVCWNLGGTTSVGTTGSLAAQFIAYCMQQDGNSHFQLTPALNFVDFPIAPGPVLIR